MNYSYFGGAFKYLNPSFSFFSADLIDYLKSAFKVLLAQLHFKS